MTNFRIHALLALLALLVAAGGLLWLWSAGPAWGRVAYERSLWQAGHEAGSLPIWGWVLILLAFTFCLGVVSVIVGQGGGTLFVALIGGFLPFHLDFVRGASLMVALCGSLSASPGLLRYCLADLRLSLPVGLVASIGAIIGAMIGLALPPHLVQVSLGLTIMGIVVVMIKAKHAEHREAPTPDAISQLLGIRNVYCDLALNQEISWTVHRTALALGFFFLVGIVAGTFGIGGGWANVAIINLMMGAPLKVAVASSKFLILMTDGAAAWIYFHSGALMPIIVVPSIIGMVLGSWLGVGILARTRPVNVRFMVIALLLFAGMRCILKGLGVWE